MAEFVPDTTGLPEELLPPVRAGGGIVPIQEFIGRPPTPALIQGTLTRTGSAQIVAASGSGKTFVVLHLAWHLASSQLATWFGREINAHGPVVYYPTEGFDTIGPRSAALQTALGDPDHPILVVERTADYPLLYDNPALTEDVLALTGGELPIALIIDTQIGVLADAGVSEQDNVEMQQALAALQRTAAALGALLVLVHHTGHGSSKDDGSHRVGKARGASSQFGYMDAVIELHNLSPQQLGKGPYYVQPTKFKPDVPWPHHEEFTFRNNEAGAYIEHVPASSRRGMASAVQTARLDRAVDYLRSQGGAAAPGDLKAELGLSDKQWEVFSKQATESGNLVREGKGPSTTFALPGPDAGTD